MKKQKMADVLWDAANKYLSRDGGWWGDAGWNEWSCNAALLAENGGEWPLARNGSLLRKGSTTDAFLKSLGCPTGGSHGKFQNYAQGSERQGVRYMWLLLAMHVAKDEGLRA